MGEKSDAFNRLYAVVTINYENWDEGEKVNWDEVGSACGEMLATFDEPLSKPASKSTRDRELRTPDSSDYMELSDGERIKLMMRESNHYDNDDDFEMIALDSVYDYDSETDTGSDRAEAREFIKEVWESNKIVAIYKGDNTNYDNLVLYGLKSNLYEFLLEENWYGEDTNVEIMEHHPEITDGGWVL